jgi:hypothetical protein
MHFAKFVALSSNVGLLVHVAPVEL